jgi:hypothetical protein
MLPCCHTQLRKYCKSRNTSGYGWERRFSARFYRAPARGNGVGSRSLEISYRFRSRDASAFVEAENDVGNALGLGLLRTLDPVLPKLEQDGCYREG